MRVLFLEWRSIVRSLTWHRIVHWMQGGGSYLYSSLLGAVHHAGGPVSASVEPSGICNLRCVQCPSGLGNLTRDRGVMSLTLYRRVIKELAPTVMWLNLFEQGEPYLNTNIFTMIRMAHRLRISTSVSTNGHFLDDTAARSTVSCGLQRLIVSVDGVDQATYSAYRAGGDLNRVLEGVRRVVDYKRAMRSSYPLVILQFLVMRHNEHQIADIQALGRLLGVDKVELKSTQVYDFEHHQEMIPLTRRYARYRYVDGQWKIKSMLANRCYRMWTGMVITWDGLVVPCCFDKDAHYVMGDITKERLSDIWNGESYRRFREQISKGRASVPMCRNCTTGLKR